jgi:hypothetical protein
MIKILNRIYFNIKMIITIKTMRISLTIEYKFLICKGEKEENIEIIHVCIRMNLTNEWMKYETM